MNTGGSTGGITGHEAGAQFGLEARARTAVLATADEIRADDVPPVPAWLAGEAADGPRRRGGHERRGDRAGWGNRAGRGSRAGLDDWAGLGGPRGAGRWGVPLAAAAAVALAAGVTTALTVNRISQDTGITATAPAYTPLASATPDAAAAQRSAAKQATSASAAALARVPSPADLQIELTGLFIPATGAQYSLGVVLQGEYQALESQVTAVCLAKAGLASAPSASLTGPGASLARYPDLAAIAKAGALPGSGSRVVVNPSASAPPMGAFLRCSGAAGELFNGMVAAGLKLGEPFTATVTKIQGSAPVLATMPALRACAAKYGWTGSGSGSPINSFADFASWVSGQVNAARGRGLSPAALRKTNEWWASAFIQCATPTVMVMEKLQDTAQRQYLAAHKEQFGALVAVAQAEFAKAVQAARG